MRFKFADIGLAIVAVVVLVLAETLAFILGAPPKKRGRKPKHL